MIRSWEEERIVEWLGHSTDMVSVLRNASLVALPSYREGLPKALLEELLGAPGLPAPRPINEHGDQEAAKPLGNL